MVTKNLVKDVVSEPYKYGFVTDIETEKISKGLNEDTIRLISEKKEEPEYLLNSVSYTHLRAHETDS